MINGPEWIRKSPLPFTALRGFADGFGGGLIGGLLYYPLQTSLQLGGFAYSWLSIFALALSFGTFEMLRVGQHRTFWSSRTLLLCCVATSFFLLLVLAKGTVLEIDPFAPNPQLPADSGLTLLG